MVFTTEGLLEVAIDALTYRAIRPWVQLPLRANIYHIYNLYIAYISQYNPYVYIYIIIITIIIIIIIYKVINKPILIFFSIKFIC